MFIVIPEILPIIYGREVIIPIFSQISLEGRFTIVISSSIILFTSAQYRSERKRNKLIDLRNELEKAYGPLYTIFNPYFWDSYGYTREGVSVQIMGININKSEKEKLNLILSNYPFMFKPEIFAYWREHLQYQHYGDDSDKRMYEIEYEFIKMIYDEYYQRLEEYNKLLGRAQR